MGHHLATMNPEAAASIKNGAAPHEPLQLPSIGSSVRYWAAPGVNRGADKDSFPALVSAARYDDGSLDLIVFFDAGDSIDEMRVPRRSIDNSFRCWDFPENSLVRSLDERLEEPGGLRGTVASLDQAVFGDYDRPPIALVSILEDFEKRLAALKKLVGDKAKK